MRKKKKIKETKKKKKGKNFTDETSRRTFSIIGLTDIFIVEKRL